MENHIPLRYARLLALLRQDGSPVQIEGVSDVSAEALRALWEPRSEQHRRQLDFLVRQVSERPGGGSLWEASWAALDCLLRIMPAQWLDYAGLHDTADRLRSFSPITSVTPEVINPIWGESLEALAVSRFAFPDSGVECEDLITPLAAELERRFGHPRRALEILTAGIAQRSAEARRAIETSDLVVASCIDSTWSQLTSTPEQLRLAQALRSLEGPVRGLSDYTQSILEKNM